MGSSCRHLRDSTAFGMRLYVIGCWFSAIAFFSVEMGVTVNVSPSTASRLLSWFAALCPTSPRVGAK